MEIFNRRSNGPETKGLHNSGVINSGSGSMGNVQNQPGAVGSHQSQVNVTATDDVTARWPELLRELEQKFAQEKEQVSDPERCRALLEFLQTQDVSDDEERRTARSLLAQLAKKCGGAPGISTLVASGMSLLATTMA